MPDSFLPNQSIRVRTPDGTLFVFIVENKERTAIDSFQLVIGKAGTAVNAWASALAAIMTLAIRKGITLEEVMIELSNITSQGSARTGTSICRSGPEGVWMALVRYKRKDPLIEDDHDEPHIRGASVGPGARVRNR